MTLHGTSTTQAVRRVYENGHTIIDNGAGTIHIACHPDASSDKDIILWENIKRIFSNALYVRSGDLAIPFLKGPDFKDLDPLRIAAIPGIILDVVVAGPTAVTSPPPSVLQQIAQQAAQSPKYNPLSALQSHPWTPDLQSTTSNNIIRTLDHNHAPVPLPSIRQNNATTTRAHKRVLDLKKVKRVIEKIAVCIDLDMLHAKGDGHPQDFQRALECYLKTVQKGQTQALISVGDLFLDGEWVQQSPTIAMDWYLKAAYLGDNNARYKIDRFRLELPRLFSSSRAPLLEGLEDVQQDKRRDKVMAGISSLDVTIDTAEGLALSCQNNSSAMQEKVKLEERVPGNQKEMKQLQPRVLSQLDVLQYHVQAVLTRFYEPREYPISRLFVVLPQDPSSWDAVNPFKNKFRLYFLCECGEHTKSISSEIEISHDIHFAKHEGYEIVRPSEFFQQYGFYILTLLKMLKFGVSVAGITVPNISHLVRSDANDQAANSLQQLRDSIERGMDSIIDWMEKIFVNEGETADEFSKQMERKEALGCADIRKLHTFLKVKDGSMVLGNLLKTVTDRGHTRWVCIDHYRVKYQENPAKEFLRVLDSVGGLFMENIGRVKVRLGSSISAEQFFSALRKARFVYELDINFDWDCDTNDLSDLDELEDALKESRVSDIRLDLRRFQTVNQLSPHALLSPSKQYNFIFRIRDLPNMRVLHILFSKDLVKFLGVQQKESRNACKTSCELVTTLINEEEFRILEEALKTDSTLTTLGLAGSSIGDNGAKTLAEVLKTNLTLTTLDLMNNSIGYGGAQALSEALKTNSTLTTLILDGNSIGSHGVQTLSEALKTNSTLTTLHLSYNTIGDGGAKALAEALKTNLTLTTLELKNNWIGSGGAQPLSEALKTNSTLTTLNLDGNSIGSGGVQALSEALKTNSALTNLHLDNNWIGDGGSKALAEALKTNLTLTTLELERNSIGYGGAQALSEALKTNSTLTTLNLDRNSIGSHGVYVLAEALKTNSTLTALHLNNNWIGSDGARVLSEALKTNSTLTTLHLYNNWIGSDVAKALDEALKTD